MNGNASVDEALADPGPGGRGASSTTRASPLARSLVLGRTNTVAVVVPDLENPTFHGVLRGLSRAAARDGYHVLIADSAESVAEERDPRRRDPPALRRPRAVSRRGWPTTTCGRCSTELQPVVLVNRDVGALRAPRGRRRLPAGAGASCSSCCTPTATGRWCSWPALRGAPPTPTGWPRCEDFLRRSPRRDGRDPALRGELRRRVRRRRRGVRDVGRDRRGGLQRPGGDGPDERPERAWRRGARTSSPSSGFDDIPFARYTTPPLTTASVPVAELGGQAWQRMWDLINQLEPAAPLVFHPQVERRGSSGPPAA